ncbi:antibiotic biosynthesis monooxygenase [Amylibacter cionae]|nr:antibiotic biosynthesis monooxygenase [Amylibacter cionae]
MIAVCVTFTIAADKMADFIPLMHRQAAQSLAKEDGCKQFDVCVQGEPSNTVFLYELYTSRAAFDQHLQSDHFKAFDVEAAPLVTAKKVDIFGQVFTDGQAGK